MMCCGTNEFSAVMAGIYRDGPRFSIVMYWRGGRCAILAPHSLLDNPAFRDDAHKPTAVQHGQKTPTVAIDPLDCLGRSVSNINSF
jgi:hypothetical protein